MRMAIYLQIPTTFRVGGRTASQLWDIHSVGGGYIEIQVTEPLSSPAIGYP
jgi:hypothetical protein